jgi:hypothetical protein
MIPANNAASSKLDRLLLDSGVDMTIRSKNNRHAVHAAAKKGKTRMCQMFIDKYEAVLHFQDDLGMTPLLESVGTESKLDTVKVD